LFIETVEVFLMVYSQRKKAEKVLAEKLQ